MEFFMIMDFGVAAYRAYKFKDLAVEVGCKYLNMTELIHNELFYCTLEVPDDKMELVRDMAFMTHIKNKKFQKYYETLDPMDKGYESILT
jgi:hypothetical protein